MKTKILATALIAAALIMSCKSERKSQYNGFEETDENLLPYGVNDTIGGEKVSNECAILNSDLEQLQRRVAGVKSPDMLMMVKKDYQHTIDSLSALTVNLPSEEAAKLNALRDSIRTSFAVVCKQYEIPAEGVIDNLNRCIKRVAGINSRDQLLRFTDCRRGMLQNLDYIHLCIESNSKRIPEVKRLAQQLKSSLENKKKQYGD